MRKVGTIDDIPSWWIVRISGTGRRKTVCSVHAPDRLAAVEVATVHHDPGTGQFVAELKSGIGLQKQA